MAAGEAALWRRAGGFNNDWDTAEAGLLLALWRDTADSPVPSTAELAAETAAAGGGLAALRAIVTRRAGPLAQAIFARLDRPLLDRIFKELYVGAPLFPRVFGEPARYWQGPGAVENERPLLDPELRDRVLALPVGILTGRIPEEAGLALELTGLTALDPDRIVVDDGRFAPKPDPAGLLHLADRMPPRPLYYFGDNPDDLTAWRRAREISGDDGLHFACCLGADADPELIRWFAAQGATLIAADVSDAVREVL
jgi:phosphoglycolate phosphatase-like HAD superfamily hydrolase